MSVEINNILSQLEELINQKIEYHFKTKKNLFSNELTELLALRAVLITNLNQTSDANIGGGSETSGGATALKQDEQIELLDSLEAGIEEIKGNFLSTSNMLGYNVAYLTGITDKFGFIYDEPATNDDGAFSFISLFKRLLLRFTSLIGDINSTAANSPNAPASINSLIRLLINQIAGSTIAPPTKRNAITPNPWTVSSTASVIPLNEGRKGLTIYNPLSFDIYVDFQSTVSNTSYAVKIPTDGYWEAPYGYTGIISIASTGANTGNILVRELI